MGTVDEKFRDLVSFYLGPQEIRLATQLAKVNLGEGETLDPTTVRSGENRIASWFLDNFKNYWQHKPEYNEILKPFGGVVNCAVLQAGGFRSKTILKNDDKISAQDVQRISGFSEPTCVIEISSKSIFDMLEHSIGEMPNESARFLQVSGLKFKWEGKTVTEVSIYDEHNTELKLKKNDTKTFWSMATTKFLADWVENP